MMPVKSVMLMLAVCCFIVTASAQSGVDDGTGIGSIRSDSLIRTSVAQQGMARSDAIRNYEDEKKSELDAFLYSCVCPGGGHMYLGKYLTGVIYLVGVPTAYILSGGDHAAPDDKPTTLERFCMLAFVGGYVANMFHAVASTEIYNSNLRQKYGLSTTLTPFDRRPAVALTGTF
jgi:hypothetical protein